jgi:TRAP transporter TAXI family solute receptor
MAEYTSLNRAVLMALCGLFAATPVYADSEHNAKPTASREGREAALRHTIRDEINTGLVGIVSEGTDYTVDLALTLAGEQTGLRLLPIAGAGALQNAKDVVFARGIDFGIVQTDVLDEIKRNPPFPGVEKYLRYVTKLYDQELHVLASGDIKSIDDLRGKKVNFGLPDSGTYTTANSVFKALGVEPEVTTLPHPVALDRLRRGEISALAYVATKPSRLFQDIRPEENLHFLPITSDLAPNYTAIAITSADYPELVSKDAPVNTVAVGTVLVAYNWPTKSERYQRVNGFVQAFFTHLKDIKARRPKWRDFDITASIAGWTRFPAAEQWLKKAELTPESDGVTVQGQVPLDPKERDAVFQEFADYLRTPKPEKTAVQLEPLQREALFREFADYLRVPRPQKAAVHLEPLQREALFQQFAEYQKRQYLMIASRYPDADH